ncbi:hypothetical protein [Saccharospirillum salsuginis]|nr:hypothetical protein [Saccharospirillum salsuginis]
MSTVDEKLNCAGGGIGSVQVKIILTVGCKRRVLHAGASGPIGLQ